MWNASECFWGCWGYLGVTMTNDGGTAEVKVVKDSCFFTYSFSLKSISFLLTVILAFILINVRQQMPNTSWQLSTNKTYKSGHAVFVKIINSLKSYLN